MAQFPETTSKENSKNKNINSANKIMNSYKIKNIDNIRSIVYHNKDIKKDNENKKLNTKKDNINIFSSSNKKN